jgi:hypothetical protein
VSASLTDAASPSCSSRSSSTSAHRGRRQSLAHCFAEGLHARLASRSWRSASQQCHCSKHTSYTWLPSASRKWRWRLWCSPNRVAICARRPGINYVRELKQLLQWLEVQKSIKNRATGKSPFAGFFSFPQYSTLSSHASCSAASTSTTTTNGDTSRYAAESGGQQTVVAKIEATMVES